MLIGIKQISLVKIKLKILNEKTKNQVKLAQTV